MKWLGFQEFDVALIVPPSDVGARKLSPHVIALAANIASLGNEPQNAVVIDDETNAILSGRDRFAAMLLNGAATIWCHVAEATPEERADLEESENLFRRPVENRTELLARRSAKVEAEITAARAKEGVTVSQAPQHSAKAEARRQVAAEAGVTPATVRQAEVRTAARAAFEREGSEASEVVGDEGAGAASVADTPAPDEPPVDMLGMTASAEWMARVRGVKHAIMILDGALRRMQGEARALPQPHQQRIYAALHGAAAIARSHMPEIACAICRDPDGTAGKRRDCLSCAGLGWMSADGKKGLHPSMLKAGAARREG